MIVDRYCVRLVALIANRLSDRWKHQVDAQDIVQSALGSFFIRANQSRLQFSQSVSLWNLLATFAKRKMARTIERRSAIKRGGDQKHVPFDEAELETSVSISQDAFNGNMESVESQAIGNKILETIPKDSHRILHLMLEGNSQAEIATALKITDRTVRRKIQKLRQQLTGETSSVPHESTAPFVSTILPRIHYGDFVLGRFVDAGSFGKVYRASLRNDGSIVAVKFLRKEFWKHAAARKSFLREIELVYQVKSRSVLKYLGWGESPHGGPYIISQWLEGKSLQDTHTNQPMTAEQFLACLTTVSEGLEAVHAKGVVHGDITPKNIICNEGAGATIIDFGFAVSPIADVSRSEPGHPLGGTLGWAAPEQLSVAFGDIGPRTDLWAIGALAYWFLTSATPLAKGGWETVLSTKPINCDHISVNSPSAIKLKTVASRALRSLGERPFTIAELFSP